MKIPDNLKDTDKRWDAWRAFHWNFPESSYRSYGHAPIVLFDTGELVVTSSYAALRREYRELDIELAATSAPGFPALATPDGREIKNAWLTQNGMQEVLIDYATGRVVSLAKRFRTEDNPQIPARFVSDYGQALAYFPGPGQAPVSPSRLIVRPPVRCGEWLQADQVELVRGIHSAVKALFTLEPARKTGPAAALSCGRLLEVGNHMDLTDGEMVMLYRMGIPRPQLEFDYLLLAA